jgi:hypothetical protein
MLKAMYDDFLGKQTNAASGVAQRERRINSVRNNVFGFDNFADMKERAARFILALFQGGDYDNILSQIMSEEEKEEIILNLTRTIHGKKYVFNDVRTLPVSLEIEEVPDYNNSMEENKVSMENVLSNVNAPLILRSPALMRMLGVREYDKISRELKEAMDQDQQVQGGRSSTASDAPQQEQNLVYPGL